MWRQAAADSRAEGGLSTIVRSGGNGGALDDEAGAVDEMRVAKEPST